MGALFVFVGALIFLALGSVHGYYQGPNEPYSKTPGALRLPASF
jgi:hypothetical protein